MTTRPRLAARPHDKKTLRARARADTWPQGHNCLDN